MGYYNNSVSMKSNEAAFINAFIAQLTDADSRIICTSRNLTATTPTFTLSLAGVCELVFTRSMDQSNQCNSYTMQCGNVQSHLVFGSLCYMDDVEQRVWKYRLITSGSVLLLSLADDTGSVTDSPSMNLCVLCSADLSAYAAATTENPVQLAFITSAGAAVKKLDRLPYLYSSLDPAAFEMIADKVFVSADSSVRALTFPGLRDVSAVTPGSLIPVSGVNYFALDTHTLMPV